MSVSPTLIGTAGQTAIYRISLAQLGQSQVQAISLNDSGFLGLTSGAESGFDLDFVKISNVLTDDPNVAGALGTVIPFDFSSIAYRAGYIAPAPAGATPALSGNTLFGATPGNQGVDLGLATLGVRDGLNGVTPGGSVSLGIGGSIAFKFNAPFDPQGLYLYFGDAGGTDRAFVGVSSTSASPFPAQVTIRGTEAQDGISLTTAANAHLLGTGVAMHGAGGNDVQIGGNGNDRLAGGGGNDLIVGGVGFDTALYRGQRSEYRFQTQPDGSLAIQDPVAGRDGTDLLYGIENLQFANVATYRFFHTQAGGHLFTTSTVERDSVQQNLPHYRYEGETFLTADQGFPNAVPVYRFFHTQAGGHLFTTSAVEAESVRANLPHYRDEGVGFHMSATPGEGLVPIYRFFHTTAGGHLFTSSAVERDVTINTLPNYRYEGVAFYAPTTVADPLFG
ncbi:hypothetical protein [Sabulicella glaciei]|uniref:DUF5648 domain-containing protein n=1 Tax=Sabulicella glaciei TaxID=2984948 RepID=A0ABT3NZD8_9PROT|nr:hypothetical protein [Roseococcus sp. MDT2-1-1]MCW8087496.1 hypothetical protein [Roseococcus sp. MDT2-1-1]